MHEFYDPCMVAHGWSKQQSKKGKVTWIAERPNNN